MSETTSTGRVPTALPELARRASFERHVLITRDATERPYNEDVALAKDVARDFLEEGTQFLLAAGGAVLPSKWLDVRVYTCSEHGEFLVRLDDGVPQRDPILVVRDGELKRAQQRIRFCPALIEISR